MIADELERRGVVAVIRGRDAAAAVVAGRALAEGGVTAIEITFTVAGAAAAIRELAAEPDLLVGAGTVVTPEQAREAVAAGARYLIAPNFDPCVVATAAELGVPLLPGVLTPTEVAAAMARCPVLKIFPASVGGPGYLRALRAPFPRLRAVPTGGVSAQNLGEWLGAGAIAVGAGGDLCPADAVDRGDVAEIRRRARDYAAALAEARS